MINTFAKLRLEAKRGEAVGIAVAAAGDAPIIEAVRAAREEGIADAILVGHEREIRELLRQAGLSEDAFRIVAAESEEEAAEKAVRLVHDGEAAALMKGLLPTGSLMRAALNREWGLRKGKVLSHTMFYECPALPRFLVNTDGGMCTFPSREQKIAILENAAELLRLLGYEHISAALLCATEKADPKIQDSVEAAEIAAMKEHWAQWNMDVFGPVGVDLAVSREACEHKGYRAAGAGEADIVLVPDYQVGNAFGKALTYFAGAESGGLILGAAAPIILVSRADPAAAKLNAIALAAVAAARSSQATRG